MSRPGVRFLHIACADFTQNNAVDFGIQQIGLHKSVQSGTFLFTLSLPAGQSV
jgi:hypothetical protein